MKPCTRVVLRVGRFPLLAALFAACSGCYSYRALNGIEAADPGSQVRVRLTPEGRAELERRTGRNEEAVEGEIAAVDPDSVHIVVGSQSAARAGRAFGTGIDTVGIPIRSVRELEAKELNAKNTALFFGGGGLAVGAFVLWRFSASGGGNPVPGPGGDGDAFRWYVHLGWPR